MLARRFPLITLLAVACLIGCDPGVSTLAPEVVAKHRERLLLADEPEGAVTPLDLREQEGGFSEGEVVLVGQIGGVANPWKDTEPAFPWKEGVASFFLVDPGAAAEHADHTGGDPDHDESCPFCARHAADNATAVAVVNFSDAQGTAIPLGAEELLALKQDTIVVVRGAARLAGELLLVDADGIYIRE